MASSILIFRIGQLGDTLVSIPAFRALRQHFPHSKFTLLCDYHPDRRRIQASSILTEIGLVDDYEAYPVDDSISGRAAKAWRMLCLLLRIRSSRFDTLIYLTPSRRTPYQIQRDLRFFPHGGDP